MVIKSTKENKQLAWTERHENIFEFVKYGRGHGIIIARAGSGKTTTIRKALDHTPPNASVLFVAFNRPIADELEKTTPDHVDVYTYHGYGLNALRQVFGKVEVDKHGVKIDRILKSLIPDKYLYGNLATFRKLVGFAKNHNLSSPVDIMTLALHHGMSVYNPDTYVDNIEKYVIPALNKCKEQINFIDFDDMCWLPVVLNIKMPQYDFVFLDEGQDTDFSQRVLLEKALRPAGRLIGVADEKQAIYSWRGATVDAVEQIVTKFKARKFPLPVTYRCAKNIVTLAQKIVPDIEALPSAPDGEVNFHYLFQNFIQDVRAGDMVLCRTTAPLIEPCFTLIESGVKASIRGLEFQTALIELIKDQKASNLIDLFQKLRIYKDKVAAKYVALERPELAQKAIDQVASIWSFSSGLLTVESLINRIGTMFSKDNKSDEVTFSTIHRAKGLEADTVWILRPDLIPHPNAKFAWELEQEKNLEYVAITRAMNTLNFVRTGYPKRKRELVKKQSSDDNVMNMPMDEFEDLGDFAPA